MTTIEKVKNILEKLVGEKVAIDCSQFNQLTIFNRGVSLGYSQFNELLLLLGFDRVTNTFFQFLVDQTIDIKKDSKISSLKQLEKGVNEFRKIALLLFANVRFGFKVLSNNSDEFIYQLETLAPIPEDHYISRHKEILEIDPISSADTYLLGYKVKDKIEAGLKDNPKDPKLLSILEKRKKFIDKGKHNLISYLASDHMDVYIATSMRLEHEYITVNKIVSELSKHPELTNLNLRWFDPTQAYCDDRIDKGLAEGLMLKRAKCTVYLAQESDTLGKDSELASTLAQGKPVIALVPKGDKKYVDNQLDLLYEIYPTKSKKDIILNQLKIFDPSLAWGKNKENKDLRFWIDNPNEADENKLLSLLYKRAKNHFDDRYKTLKESHPLGIQVDLDTGVATGVLVVRNIDSCAELVRDAVLKSIEFDIIDKKNDIGEYTYLIEKRSKCIFRVETGDQMLTNTFWNFYLYELEERTDYFKDDVNDF